MEDQVCRAVAEIAGRGLVEFPWMASKQLAMATAQFIRQTADSHESVEIVSVIIQCAVSYIV